MNNLSDIDEVQIDGKYRPVRNSMGRLIHTTPQGIHNFWRWFGDSDEDLLDNEDRPIVWFRGNPSGIGDMFLPGMRRSGLILTKQALPRWYFVTLPRQASHYATGEGESVGAYYLRGEVVWLSGDDTVATWASKLGVSSTKWDRIERLRHVQPAEMVDALAGQAIKKLARSNVVLRFADDTSYNMVGRMRVAVVFSPTQIKSATGNRGTFDPADPVISNPAGSGGVR